MIARGGGGGVRANETNTPGNLDLACSLLRALLAVRKTVSPCFSKSVDTRNPTNAFSSTQVRTPRPLSFCGKLYRALKEVFQFG